MDWVVAENARAPSRIPAAIFVSDSYVSSTRFKVRLRSWMARSAFSGRSAFTTAAFHLVIPSVVFCSSNRLGGLRPDLYASHSCGGKEFQGREGG